MSLATLLSIALTVTLAHWAARAKVGVMRVANIG
jgi:hypothetical protein